MGLGIGINAETVHSYLIMVNNEGILPFIDFLEFLCAWTMIQFNSEDKKYESHPIFKNEYFLYLVNEVSFFIYWEIDSEFLESSFVLGL